MNKVIVSLGILLVLGLSLNAQQKSTLITGQVRASENKEPLQGVSVTVKGAKNSSGSQEDGIFYIEIKKSDSTLIFTHPDFEAKEVKLSHEKEYNVELRKKHH